MEIQLKQVKVVPNSRKETTLLFITNCSRHVREEEREREREKRRPIKNAAALLLLYSAVVAGNWGRDNTVETRRKLV